ncbi:MAG: valine--tRNA ligase [Gammaproteobacteria bacterium]|nr:MAG: valine--tRNA ligase [Gammaproteobacteria bacterium]
MEKTYQPEKLESHWYQTWGKNGYFKPSGTGESYCIMIPPPNVTGTLHMGHAFQDTLMDLLVRYHRMQGHNTLWQAGTDHAGIATQMVVERQLAQEGKSRHDLGRDAFIEKVWQWKEKSGGAITQQLRRMGSSLDWSRERFTMDDGMSNAVKEVFVRLFEEDLIYRGKRLVNWDPVLHTAVSDLEVISEEKNGHLWHIRYPIANSDQMLTVATTRPETMLGDAAVAIHPDDERYKHLVGQSIKLPITHRLIPIIADDYVDPEFGSGCVKITPAHDFNDYEVWQRHKDNPLISALFNGGLINIFNDNAHVLSSNDKNTDADLLSALLKEIPTDLQGVERYAARKAVLSLLEEQGLLEETKPHKLMVPRGDRSGSVIEPYLTDQWYVKIGPLAEPAIAAVENGDVRFVPDNWKNTYFEWMRNIQDWCISRQIWWGHRIPAWYDTDGKVYVGRSEQEVREKHALSNDIVLKQDEDVLDTWFSSALWPFSTQGWPEKTEDLKTFYPGNVLVTGFDIIFFWVARMIMMGLKFTGEVPFKEVYINGLVRDSHGQKMSKSKGNVLDPIDFIDGIDLEALVKKRTSGLMQPEMAPKIEKATRKDFTDGIPAFGTDALRFTFASLASTGRDIKFDMGRIEGYRNFCNKLWNATRYVMMNCEDQAVTRNDAKASIADRWMQSILRDCVEQTTQQIGKYRFDHAAQTIYSMVWDEYCDWYLELTKPILNDNNIDDASKAHTRYTLLSVLDAILRLLHPITPFITEELWQRVTPLLSAESKDATIMLQPYPQAEDWTADTEAVNEIEWIKTLVLGVRQIRSGYNISPGKRLSIILQDGSAQDQQHLTKHELFLLSLAKLESITWLNVGDEAPESATSLVGQMKVLIPMAGLIDKDAELKRLNKEIEKTGKLVFALDKKLSTPGFTDKAPAAVVEKERERLVELQKTLESLRSQFKTIESL